MIYTFGNHFECDTGDATLRQDGVVLELEPDVFRLLAYLLEHRDDVVAKTELLDTLWPDETVSLDGVTRYVRAARRAVGDDGYRQGVIETVRGEGYRFLAEVEVREALESEAGSAPEPWLGTPAERVAREPLVDAGPEKMPSHVEESGVMADQMSSHLISRSMTFSLQYYQAGLGILNYVGTVLRQRYPDRPIKVWVEQDYLPPQLIVRLLVEASDETRLTIERDLALYGLVVAAKMVPEEFLPEPLDVQALRHKLDLTRRELRLAREHLLSVQRSGHLQQERITSLGADVAEFQQLIRTALEWGEEQGEEQGENVSGGAD